jgi:copper chaperone CopZ
MERDIGRDEAGSSVTDIDPAVPSMVCDGCVQTIRTALKALPGARQSKVSLWRKRVRLRYERGRLGEDEIRRVVVASGFVIQDMRIAR